ncbi:MFS transporter [Ideonella sp. BN130291]|uniref:MFS transporter n=1 Tax=Ideonella sp. BN130291 TaxID=3112940 RepID=UPI002E26353C|nr:MFS transporter [Ideonella sp. BN130291]
MPDPQGGNHDTAAPGPAPGVNILALIIGQVGLHSTMAGTRMAAPLQALREGYSAWTVGVLMALFAAAPVLLALPAGRLADRHGYHRPVHIAAGLSIAGALLAVLSTWLQGTPHLLLLFAAASLCGGGANVGLIAIQRTAGRSARDSTERMRVFSWLGVAPSLSNVVGPVMAGLLIDGAGFWAAYGFLLLLPLVSVGVARLVPRERPVRLPRPPGRTAWDLWRVPGLQRLMIVNWLLSACWDVHSFAVPILGHERGFSASTIGLVLGVFPLSVSAVRLLIPLLAHRMQEAQVLRAAMVGTGLVFCIYPLVASPWLMAACATVLGVTLGCVQPMIMSTLHRLTPHDRHGEAIALRSMTLNLSSTVMPLLFGAAGTALGVAPLFWLMGASVGGGNWLVRQFDAGSEADAA